MNDNGTNDSLTNDNGTNDNSTNDNSTNDNGTGESTSEQAAKINESSRGAMGRFGAAGMPLERSKDLGGAVKRLASQMGPEGVGLVSVVVLALVSVTLLVLGPRLLGNATQTIVDGVMGQMSGGSGIDFGELHRILLITAAVYIVATTLSYVQNWVLAGVVQRTMFRLRSAVEDKLNRMPLSYVDRQARGDLLSRVTNDIDNLAQSMQQTLSQLLSSSLQLVGVLVMMFTISWQLAMVTVIIVPITIVTMRKITSRSKKRFVEQWRYTGVLNAQVEEAFTGHALVKVYNRQTDVEDRFRQKNDELFEASAAAQFMSGSIQPAVMFLGNVNYVLIALLGGLMVTNGSMNIGDIQAFIQYSRQFTQPLTQVASMLNVMQSGIASAERVFELLDAPEEPDDATTDLSTVDVRGRIEFADVAFSYTADKPLIRDLSLVAQPGETVAIVGPTGAGKTTMVNLIMRFYDVDSGAILLDGVDTATISRQDLRRHMGMVLQDTWLFGGTIRENIAYGNLNATDDQILEAARATYVDRFVHSLPDGYDTVIDDEGGTVSAGEKQLLTIARAFLSDPTILILDEATSSVDTRTEVLIQKAMAALRSNRTSFVIAHRLSTIRDADTILVMEHGDIVEQGDHDTLIAADGAYARLYNAQFAGAAVDIDAEAVAS